MICDHIFKQAWAHFFCAHLKFQELLFNTNSSIQHLFAHSQMVPSIGMYD